ncbi:DEAD/DEAH box helicase [Jannaschia formosa]|uniref:DEAD/DEAH box helicase n=1 Tax=Jannaschia formosa TaxID=2259592 RepID=UPI000E1B9920|nr:DEAD/DEAH box helicase [Jannaschia formosa]TFL18212.1 DEAD/DEAH box helicase [Jannaschia formosa]
MTQTLSDRDRDLLFGAGPVQPGDAVVHFEHGLASYDGETELEVEGVTQRLAVFVYRNGGKLMLPAIEGRDFWPYGAPAGDVTLDRLDAGDWIARRDEMIAELRDHAGHLLEEHRARHAHDARPLRPDEAAMTRFAETFPHEETEDQARAIAATLADLARDVPMNRLVIGDVGFGKTEIAVRAAAACILAGHQVAMAAPTTVLARQHFDGMRSRLKEIGAEVVELSRLSSASESAEARARIASGEARMVVGTSALLSEEIAFDNLALVIVDEEQKFGREQKAALSALAPGCHLLGMTATPIPRSLAAAEVGLLDVSVLAEPPKARRPVETRIAAPSDDLLREAVTEEVARGGQVYVVAPRIEGLERIDARLDALDGISHAVAHGQLSEAELETQTLAFAEGRVDVLLSTAIVENGLDNPRANTMVVYDAELFGLSQLHQLRGRIGRSDLQAKMLLLTGLDLHDEESGAVARLKTFTGISGLGGGFRISRADRDLRGFGALDGDEQSGQVSRLGIGLYRHILREHLSTEAEDA